MRMTLFLSIMHKLSETSPYFCERYDVTSRTGLTALQKCTGVLRQLAYSMTTDIIDEYLNLGKTIGLECLEFLRRPTVTDTQRLLAKLEERGFPDMLESIDYMH
jgi:hypothetical protein